MRKLVYVSNNVILPDGSQNPFFLQEKAWLAGRFGEFQVVCPQGVYVCDGERLELRVRSGIGARLLALLRGLLDRHVYEQFPRMCRDGALNLRNILKVYLYAFRAALLRPMIDAAAEKDAVLYSYWLSYDAYAVAQVRSKRSDLYAFSRAHSYELQRNRNACNPYLMKRFTCDNLDKVAFISQNSLEEFLAYYSGSQEHFCVQYLGTSCADACFVEREREAALTVVSCSSIVPVKQLDHLISALENWDLCPLRWHHIGEGTDGEKIRDLAAKRLAANPSIEYTFHGYMKNSDVRKFLTDSELSVFVNCSRSEGVPVSIMEAMSFGIPVVAPRICGIPELVVPGTGLLYEAEEGVAGLKAALEAFAQRDAQQHYEMGKLAFAQWQKCFCLEKNLTELFNDVDSQ